MRRLYFSLSVLLLVIFGMALMRIQVGPVQAEAEATIIPEAADWHFLPMIFGSSVIIATPTPTPTAGIPTFTPTPTVTPTPTPTNTPTPVPPDGLLAMSSDGGGIISGVGYADEDVFAYHTITKEWSLLFEGSDIGLGGVDLDAFDILPDGSMLLSPDVKVTIPGLGDVMGEDVIRFVPVSLGLATDGDLEWYFDGSDVGLSGSDENVDGIGVAPDGRLLLSTTGDVSAGGFLASDEDLIAFTASELGETTSGTWSIYLNGSRVSLSADSEDINAAWVHPSRDDLFLSTRGTYSIPGADGDGADIIRCLLLSGGSNSSCQWSLYWDASKHGLTGQDVDGLEILPDAPPPTTTPICQNRLRVMPLGDSLTRGYISADNPNLNGYRRRLYLSLRNAGYGLNLVGSQQAGMDDFDRDHEGHGGWHAAGGPSDGIAAKVYDWLSQNPADIVLLHIGTNDISNNGEDADEVAQILDEIDRYSEKVIVVLAQIINRTPYSGRTSQYNQDLKTMAEARIAQGDQLILVNMESALEYPDDLNSDGIHPNEVGYVKMAAVWEAALDDLLPRCP